MTLSRTARLVAAAFTVNGVVHLVRPQVFEPAMPAWVPARIISAKPSSMAFMARRSDVTG